MPTGHPSSSPTTDRLPGPRAARFHHPLTPWAFLLPALLVLLLFSLIPTMQAVYYSFTRYNAFNTPEFVGLENYRRAFSDGRFWFCTVNSFLYLLVTPALMAVSLAAAMVIHSGIRGGKALRVLLFLPVVTPTIVAATSFRLLFNEDAGLINWALAQLGLAPVGWLTRYPWTLISAMTVTLWKGVGYYMMIFLAGLIAIPREVEEAATTDGAGRLRLFWHVTLPGLRPVLALVAVISSISALKVFDEIYVTVEGAPLSHQTVVPLIHRTLSEDGDYGLASAMGILLFAVILVFSIINLRLQRAE